MPSPSHFRGVRRTAAYALGCIGPPAEAAAPPLATLGNHDPVLEVRESAAAALVRIKRK